jgi:hypothetical protein
MGFNPFSSDNEDSSFEQGAPVSQAAKNVTQAVATPTKAQLDVAQDIVNQLYAPSTPQGQDQGTDETNTQHSDQSNAATRAVAAAQSGGAHKGQSAKVNPNQTPEEQAQMEKVRHELFGSYSAKYKTAQNGPFNITTSLDQEMEKARKEREQKEAQRKQEEEEEEKRKKEQEEQQQQQLDMPAGKKTGMTMGKKQQQPFALTLAKTKTESNRGSTG